MPPLRRDRVPARSARSPGRSARRQGHARHEAGGEPTNALRRRPFPLILFDGAGKAHPRVRRMFLQIRDEGRLTDSRGATAFFPEAGIVPTSEIGIVVADRATGGG